MSKASSKIWKPEKKKKRWPRYIVFWNKKSTNGQNNSSKGKWSTQSCGVIYCTYPVKGFPFIKGGMTIPNLRELIDPGTHLLDTKNLWVKDQLGTRQWWDSGGSRRFLCFFGFRPSKSPWGNFWQMDIYTKWWCFFLAPRTRTQNASIFITSPLSRKTTKRKSLQFQHAGYPTHQPTGKIHGQVNLP